MPTPVNEMLLTGGPSTARGWPRWCGHLLSGGTVTFRSDVLAGLTGGPLQHGAFTLFTLAVGVAAVLGLAVMLLELALGAAERDSTLARLATMGLGERQRAWVVALEVLPAVIAARAGRLGVRAGAAPGAGPGHRPVGVHRVRRPRCRWRPTSPRSRCRSLGLALVAAVALGIEIRSGTPTRRSVPSSGRMNGRPW